jgi:anti-sigma B factor antagonist
MDLTFDIVDQWIGETLVVKVIGEIDVASAPQLQAHLDSTALAGADTVVVDLTGVTFIDSTALEVLVGVHRRQAEAGGQLRLVITEPSILKVFDITDLAGTLSIVAGVDEALSG